jgi:predicted dehydrogenase/acetyltransferase-like isoleucine patch superfamily enzyme
VIGCGYWGKNLVRNFAELGALAAVADSYAPNAEAQSKQHGVPVKSIADILADATIGGVVIAAPAAQHAALASEALAAGKHVFVEKPLALTVKEAQALETDAAKAKRTLMVGHLMQYHPHYIALREMIAKGTLGNIQYVYSNRLNLGKLRTEENVLWSFAPHDISMVLGLFGEAPVSVSAQATTVLTTGVPDIYSAQFTFKSGAKGHVFVSWLHPTKEQKLVVVGSNGMATFDDGQPWESKLLHYPHSITWQGNVPTPNKAEGVAVTVPQSEPLKNECQHFLDAITGKEAVARTDAAEGIRVLAVLETAEKALKSGKTEMTDTSSTLPYYAHETAIIDEGCQIGEGSKIWHFSHILSGTIMGSNVSVGQNVMIGPLVKVGDNCKIQNNVSLYKGVELGQGVFCGPSCVFTNVNTPRAEVERKDAFLPTPVGRGATIGANATIICGHSLGEYCLIGAGAVVTKNVKPHALMVGNPAKQIAWVSHAGEKLGADLVCPREGRKYRITQNNELEEITVENPDASGKNKKHAA